MSFPLPTSPGTVCFLIRDRYHPHRCLPAAR